MQEKALAQCRAGGEQSINAKFSLRHILTFNQNLYLRQLFWNMLKRLVAVSLPPGTHMFHSSGSKCNHKPFTEAGKPSSATYVAPHSELRPLRQQVLTTRSTGTPQMSVNTPFNRRRCQESLRPPSGAQPYKFVITASLGTPV